MVNIAGLRNGWLLPAIHCRAQDGVVYLLLFLNELRLHLGLARVGPRAFPDCQCGTLAGATWRHRLCCKGCSREEARIQGP